ncbi:polysaccharide deacetylase family protein [Hahella sp. SMD15-11]|uniref:Polysaccharide deacetylase family protein n=1 Tax=Thermohahella caldifontis TaxID=3142973 RepID=A0AB39UYF8_9GAMM
MTGFAARVMLLLGVLLSPLSGRGAVILMYHHVSDDTPPATSISPDLFEKHLEWIEASGLPVMPLTTLLDRTLNRGEEVEGVAITFDDGYANVFTQAFPRLRARGWPFTVFINPARVGISSIYADWAALQAMHDYGALIANHTRDHPHLVNLDAAAIRHTIERAQADIEARFGKTPRLLAYPYGERSLATDQVLKALGFLGLSQHSGAVSPETSPLDIPRFPMNNHYGQEKDFRLRLLTRALPWQPDATDPLVRTGEIPVLRFSLSDTIGARLNCFAEGERIPVIRIGSGRWQTATEHAFRQRRFKYTCTAPESRKRFYWSSWLWIRPELPE